MTGPAQRLWLKFAAHGALIGMSTSAIIYPLVYSATSHPYSPFARAVFALLPYLWPGAPLMMFAEAHPTSILFGVAIATLTVLSNALVYGGAATTLWAGLRVFVRVRQMSPK